VEHILPVELVGLFGGHQRVLSGGCL